MDHLAQPLEELHARASQFVADPGARVLYVPVDDELFEGARALLATLQWHPENRGPFVALDTPYARRAPGWSERRIALQAAYDEQVAGFDRDAVTLPSVDAPDASLEPLPAFAVHLAAIAGVFSAEGMDTNGVVVFLAPRGSGDAGLLARDLGQLVSAPALAQVRWIWLDRLSEGSALAVEDAKHLGADAWVVPCRIDRDAQDRERDQLIASMIAALETGGPPGVARPRIAPPPHPADPPKGAVPAPGVPSAVFLRPLLEGVRALCARKPEEAIVSLRHARDACLTLGNAAEAVETELLIGAVATELAGRRQLAPESVAALLDGAAKRAEEAGLHAQAAKALLIRGCFANLVKDAEGAAGAFMRASAAADRAKLPALRFQILRLAGDLALAAGLRERTQALWEEALDAVAAVSPVEAETNGLREGADALVAEARKRGLTLVAGPPVAPPLETTS